MAEIERLKSERAGLLLAPDHPSQLNHNLADLTRAMADATQISELIDRLQEQLQKAAPDQCAEQGTPAEAWAELLGWVAANAATIMQGAHLVAALFKALAPPSQPSSEQAKTPSNVTQLQPRPPGAA